MRGNGTDAVWSLVMPLKPLAYAKSRLSEAVGEGARPLLALAFAQDAVAAALACRRVRDVAVVTDDARAAAALRALGARILPDVPGAGLNAALAHGARTVAASGPVAALNPDLPALRPAELGRVLKAAAQFPRAFLADAAGIGTTLLTAGAGGELAPAFGGASRARHAASGAAEIAVEGVDSVRRDVDTGADLRVAVALGVGRHTAELLRGPAFALCPAAVSPGGPHREGEAVPPGG